MNLLRLSFLIKNCALWTLSCDFVAHNYETLTETALIAAHLTEVILVVTQQCSDRYIISPTPLSSIPPSAFSPSLISLMVPVDELSTMFTYKLQALVYDILPDACIAVNVSECVRMC